MSQCPDVWTDKNGQTHFHCSGKEWDELGYDKPVSGHLCPGVFGRYTSCTVDEGCECKNNSCNEGPWEGHMYCYTKGTCNGKDWMYCTDETATHNYRYDDFGLPIKSLNESSSAESASASASASESASTVSASTTEYDASSDEGKDCSCKPQWDTQDGYARVTIYGCGADYETDAGETKKYCETVDPTCNNDQGWKDCSVSENQAAMEAEAAKAAAAAAAAAAAVTTYSKKSSGTCATSIPKDKCVKAEKYIGIYGNAGPSNGWSKSSAPSGCVEYQGNIYWNENTNSNECGSDSINCACPDANAGKDCRCKRGEWQGKGQDSGETFFGCGLTRPKRVDDIKTYLDMNPERKDVVYSGASMFKVMAHILDDWNAKDRCETVDPTCATPEADQSEDTRGWGSEGWKFCDRNRENLPCSCKDQVCPRSSQDNGKWPAYCSTYSNKTNGNNTHGYCTDDPSGSGDGSWIYCLPTDCPSETHYIREKGDGFECAKRSTEEELNCPEGTTFYTQTFISLDNECRCDMYGDYYLKYNEDNTKPVGCFKRTVQSQADCPGDKIFEKGTPFADNRCKEPRYPTCKISERRDGYECKPCPEQCLVGNDPTKCDLHRKTYGADPTWYRRSLVEKLRLGALSCP